MMKVINKYKSMSDAVKASLWFTFSNVLLKGIAFITLPIFSRLLTTSDFGLVSVFTSWTTLFSIIATLTLWGGVFNVFLVNRHSEINKIVSTLQGLATTITIFLSIIGFIFIETLSDLLGLPVIMTAAIFIDVLFQIPYNLWAGKQRFDYKYKAVVIISIIVAILNPLIGCIAVINVDVEFRAIARVLSIVGVNVALGIFITIVNFSKGKAFFDKIIWKSAFLFNIVLVPHYLSMEILSQSDRIMIKGICGDRSAGIYSTAYTFGMLLNLLSNAINSSYTPYVYKSIKEGKEKEIASKTNGVVLLVAIFCIALICVAPDVFMFMLPESYYPALSVIPPVAAGAFFMFLYPLFGSVEFYYGEKKYVTFASITGAALNIGLNYIFIKLYGFIAAAYTTLVCYMLFSVCHYIFMKLVLKKYHKENPYDWKFISLVSLIVSIVSVVMAILYGYNLIRWIIIAVIIILCVIFHKHLFSIVLSLFKKTTTNDNTLMNDLDKNIELDGDEKI